MAQGPRGRQHHSRGSICPCPEVQPEVLQGIVTTWLAQLQDSEPDPLDDLLAMPRVEVRGPTLIEIVVDAKRGSRFWSDELLSLAVYIHDQRAGFLHARPP